MLVRSLVIVTVLAAASTAGVALAFGATASSALGGGLALAGGVVGLLLLARGLRRDPEGTNGVFGAFVGAMLLRIVLLGAGLVLAVKLLGVAPIPFVVAFFVVHLVAQVAEVLFVQRAGRSRRTLAS